MVRRPSPTTLLPHRHRFGKALSVHGRCAEQTCEHLPVTDDPALCTSLEVAVPTVLIIDDDADHRELMTLTLRRFGHQVVEAADARAAQRLIDAGGVDAVLLDVRMPGESGIDFCRRLRDEPDTAALPVMFVTADVNDHRIEAAVRAGADDYLTKPFHRAELATRLDNLLLRRTSGTGRPGTAATAALLAARHALRVPFTVEAPLRRTA
jgi:DNA-binding response OmpR family regulator